ncbi:MAG: hypothetical protein AAFY76_22805 [Cyanobacteria bacterium J06649_11]
MQVPNSKENNKKSFYETKYKVAITKSVLSKYIDLHKGHFQARTKNIFKAHPEDENTKKLNFNC